MKRTKHFGKLWLINNHTATAICRGRYHAESKLDYSMIRAGKAQCSVLILPIQKKDIFTVILLKMVKSKST